MIPTCQRRQWGAGRGVLPEDIFLTHSSNSCTHAHVFLKPGVTQPDLALQHYTAPKHRQLPAAVLMSSQGTLHFQPEASVLF